MDYSRIQEQIVWLVLEHTRIEIEKLYKMIAAGNQIIKINIKQLESDGYLEVVQYGNTFVFTGALEKMVRRDAMQIVVSMGGNCADGVKKTVDFLVLGNNDYCSSIRDGKSSKQKKAEELILKGYPIQIISEDVFYEMIEN